MTNYTERPEVCQFSGKPSVIERQRLGNTTKLADKSEVGVNKKSLNNQSVRTILDEETGEHFSYVLCPKTHTYLKAYDPDEVLMERWLLLNYSRRFLSRSDFWEDREKAYYAPYTDLTARAVYCDLVTRKKISVLSHKIGQPVVRQKRHFYHGKKFSEISTRRETTTQPVNRAPKFRVVKCLRSTVPKKSAELHQHIETGSVNWKNVSVCGSVWTCPICSAKINFHRRQQISDAYSSVSDIAGGSAYMLTFTIKHGFQDRLSDLIEKMKQAYRIFEKSHAFKSVTRKIALKRPQSNSLPHLGYIGRISNLEVTHSSRNGWHPHEHQLWFFRRKLKSSEINKIRDLLFSEWKRSCMAVDLPPPRKYIICPTTGKRKSLALDIREALSASEYLTKFGQFKPDGSIRERRWGVEKELAGSHIKTANRKGSTPFQLLYQAATGCNDSKNHYIEFALAFRGRHQLQFSRSLKSFLRDLDGSQIDESEHGDIVLVNSHDQRSVFIANLTDKEFDKVVRNSVQGELLIVARDHGSVGVQKFIDRLPDWPSIKK